MARMQSKVDSNKEVAHLEQRYVNLKARVAAYETRRALSATEQLSLHQLKKEKLATKDALAQLRPS
jgi:hypothetical protein